MEQGDYEKGIIAQALATGRAIPAKIANAPTLMTGLDLFYEAFLDLNTCRINGFGVGQIMWSTIKDYAIAMEFSQEQTEDLFDHIRAMDNAFMEQVNKKSSSKQPTSGNKKK